MNNATALTVLISAAELGQKNGLYTFTDSQMILQAIQTLVGTESSGKLQYRSNLFPKEQLVKQNSSDAKQEQGVISEEVSAESTVDQGRSRMEEQMAKEEEIFN